MLIDLFVHFQTWCLPLRVKLPRWENIAHWVNVIKKLMGLFYIGRHANLMFLMIKNLMLLNIQNCNYISEMQNWQGQKCKLLFSIPLITGLTAGIPHLLKLVSLWTNLRTPNFFIEGRRKFIEGEVGYKLPSESPLRKTYLEKEFPKEKENMFQTLGSKDLCFVFDETEEGLSQLLYPHSLS